jgi:hypothetical protein
LDAVFPVIKEVDERTRTELGDRKIRGWRACYSHLEGSWAPGGKLTFARDFWGSF